MFFENNKYIFYTVRHYSNKETLKYSIVGIKTIYFHRIKRTNKMYSTIKISQAILISISKGK